MNHRIRKSTWSSSNEDESENFRNSTIYAKSSALSPEYGEEFSRNYGHGYNIPAEMARPAGRSGIFHAATGRAPVPEDLDDFMSQMRPKDGK